ncbi:hypothetical protein TruAng_006442 [Truncatella angustata]|nr:hypothetical protein TruAng_006442 [Truncatella angustata]
MDWPTARRETLPYGAALLIFSVGFFVIYPLVAYFRDPKGLRRFSNFSPFAGITTIPFMILAHGGARSAHLAKLHQKEPVLRIGPNTLSFGSVRAIKDIYGHGTHCTKDESYILTASSHYHLADVVDKGEHARKRKVLSSAYALKNLESWEYKVADKVERMVAQFDQRCTAPLLAGMHPLPEDLNIDFRMWSNFFSLDAIADIGVSERLNLLDNGHDQVVAQGKDGSLFKANIRESLYPIARKQSLLYGANHSWEGIVLRRGHQRLERYRAGEKLDDFFQALMEDKNGSPNNLEWGEIIAEINIMMNAGSVTTAIALTNVLYQLLRNPKIMARLHEEVDAVLDPEEVVAPYDKIKHLPYLKACLDESLRLFPPTPQGLPRKTPAEGASIMGHFIPGNTTVSVSAFVAHRDESVFHDADSFNPERFLGEGGKNMQASFIAFSAGARGCIGRNISYLEQAVLLASVIHRYDFSLGRGFELQREETMNHILGEMPVKVWRRDLGKE